MEVINNFLQKFKNITPPDTEVKKALSQTLVSILNLNVNTNKISFNQKTGVIFLKITNIKKTVIFLKKTEIIKKINKLLKKDLISDIR
jgi:hypothetical protein